MKRTMVFVISVVLNCFLCTSVYGLDAHLEKSLFLPEDCWLLAKIRECFKEKEYRNLCSVMVADCDHVITCKYGINEAFTDTKGNTLIQIPLKPKGERTTYKNCESGKGGYVSLMVHFGQPYEKLPEQAKVEEFNFLPDTLPDTAFYGIEQKEIDVKLKNAIESKKEEYPWMVEEGKVSRNLIATKDGSQVLGYLIENTQDVEKKVLWGIKHCPRFGIRQYEFKEWKTIESQLVDPVEQPLIEAKPSVTRSQERAGANTKAFGSFKKPEPGTGAKAFGNEEFGTKPLGDGWLLKTLIEGS